MEWQPIETAPRDGTPILAFCPDDDFLPITGMDTIVWEASYDCWFWAGQELIEVPTHWMPLPEAPK